MKVLTVSTGGQLNFFWPGSFTAGVNGDYWMMCKNFVLIFIHPVLYIMELQVWLQ